MQRWDQLPVFNVLGAMEIREGTQIPMFGRLGGEGLTRDQALVRFIGRNSAVALEHVMAEFGVGRTAAYRRIAACEERGFVQRLRLLREEPNVLRATRAGLRYAGLGAPCRRRLPRLGQPLASLRLDGPAPGAGIRRRAHPHPSASFGPPSRSKASRSQQSFRPRRRAMDDPHPDSQKAEAADQEQPEEGSMFPMPEMDLELREGLVEENKESGNE
jgi:hypothetical protein